MRRIPNRIARGLFVASVAAVGFFVLHVGGWGLMGRLSLALAIWGFAVGLPVALFLSFLLAAPALRAMARAGALRRARAIWLGAATYGGIVFIWMALLRAGPPDAAAAWLAAAGLAGTDAEVLLTALYRHALSPLAFALYGAGAAALGWAAAFGARAAVDAAVPGALERERA